MGETVLFGESSLFSSHNFRINASSTELGNCHSEIILSAPGLPFPDMQHGTEFGGFAVVRFDPLLSGDTINPCYSNEVWIECPALPALPCPLCPGAAQPGHSARVGGQGLSPPGGSRHRELLCLLLAGLFVCVSLQLSLMFQVFRNGGVFSTDQINVTKLIKCFNTQGEETEGNWN